MASSAGAGKSSDDFSRRLEAYYQNKSHYNTLLEDILSKVPPPTKQDKASGANEGSQEPWKSSDSGFYKPVLTQPRRKKKAEVAGQDHQATQDLPIIGATGKPAEEEEEEERKATDEEKSK